MGAVKPYSKLALAIIRLAVADYRQIPKVNGIPRLDLLASDDERHRKQYPISFQDGESAVNFLNSRAALFLLSDVAFDDSCEECALAHCSS